MDFIDVVILAAGVGSRLNSTRPKCLNALPDGRTILQQQLDNVRLAVGERARVTIVVGFQPLEIIVEAPCVQYVYNERFDVTNTNRSLLRALELQRGGSCVWMNGDVVFSPEVLERLIDEVDAGHTAIAVNTARVADEEVKYTVGAEGYVAMLSKEVPPDAARGESVGVNVITHSDKASLIAALRECSDSDYFEKAIELAICQGLPVVPVDISDLYAVEVDTPEDLQTARAVYAAHLQGTRAGVVQREVRAPRPVG